MRFYVMKSVGVETPETTEFYFEEPAAKGEAPRCERCQRYIGLLRALPPYRVELEAWGRAFGDVAYGAGRNLLISQRLKALYEEEGLSGLQGFEPVKIIKVKRKKKTVGEPPLYFHATVVRGQSAVDVEKSGIEWHKSEICPVCREGRGLIARTRRVVVDESTWTGDDLFEARGLPGTTIASDRFRAFCERHVITNVVLILGEEYSFDYHPEEWADRE